VGARFRHATNAAALLSKIADHSLDEQAFGAAPIGGRVRKPGTFRRNLRCPDTRFQAVTEEKLP
jgi:hypothetical protein